MVEWLTDYSGLTAELARDEMADIDRISDAMDALEKRIAERVRTAAPSLLTIPGCGDLTAAKIVSEVAGIERFRNEAAFARYVGLAPVPHWSGTTNVSLKPSRRGNRQLNVSLHRIAITQIRRDSPGKAYFERRLAGGDTRHSALRSLKRRLSRVVYQRLRADRELRKSAPGQAAVADDRGPFRGGAVS
ncbi:hypothetical protein BH09ACT7_BH09ACT7_08320 [soil metagenome]